MAQVAGGDQAAFEEVYDLLASPIFGVIRRVLRNPAQSEEVAQEVFVELWRSAPRYDRTQGTVLAWAMTVAHRRAVDRVRAEQAAADREQRVGRRSQEPAFDEVAEIVEARFERQAVRRCLDGLTETQRESVTLAYYGGHTYREVADLMDIPLSTVKTRIRDGLIRLRDCLGVAR